MSLPFLVIHRTLLYVWYIIRDMKITQAETILANVGKAGFRKANKKDIAKAKDVVKEDRNKRAKEFLAEYKELCKKHSIEVKAQLEQMEGMPAVKASLFLDEYVEPTKAKTVIWSEAMTENLDARSICDHKAHAEGNICEKCGTAISNWDTSGRGITTEYRNETLETIEAEKAKEATAVDKEAA